MQRYSRGLRELFGRQSDRESGAWVRIPVAAPVKTGGSYMDLKDKIELLKKQEREKTVKIACADKLFALVNSNKKTLGKRPLSFEEINILLENAESVNFIMPKTGEYIEIVEDEEELQIIEEVVSAYEQEEK